MDRNYFFSKKEKLAMDMLAALDAFIAVADTGSLSRAATRLGKTPSAITKAIHGLEASLGVRVLERTTRHVALTEAGRIYLETAGEVQQRLAEARQRIAELDGRPRGLLRLTAPLSYGRAVLAEFGPRFLLRYPEVELNVTLCDRFVDMVAEGFDLALRLGRHDLPNQIVKVVGNNRVLICASPDYLARHATPSSPEQLAEHACLLYRHPMLNPGWLLRRDGRTWQVAPCGPMVSDNYDLLLDATLAGMGIFPCPQWSVIRHIREGRLVPLLSDYEFEGESFGREHVYAAYPSTRRDSPKVRLFVAELTEWMAEHFCYRSEVG